MLKRLADEKAINAVSNWFEDMQPFNEQTPKEFLVSFSTGFISRKGDGVNPEEIRYMTWEIRYKRNSMGKFLEQLLKESQK